MGVDLVGYVVSGGVNGGSWLTVYFVQAQRHFPSPYLFSHFLHLLIILHLFVFICVISLYFLAALTARGGT